MARRRLIGALAATAFAAAVSILAAPGPAADAAPRLRGIVQGSYAPSWSHAARMRMLEWLAEHGFNAYVHAPKWDPYHAWSWRRQYPDRRLHEFQREIALARRLGIAWVPTLSPGHNPKSRPPGADPAPSTPVCFSCPEDLATIMSKLGPFRRMGVHTFFIAFDDARPRLEHPRDLAVYGSGRAGYGRAHADLVNRVLAALRARDPDARLLTIGAEYHGVQDSAYKRALRETLDPSIAIMWTGPDDHCCGSTPYSASAVAGVRRLFGRRPVLWENWVNNSRQRGPEQHIFLGPYRRPPGVARAINGVIFNAAREPDLNMLPLATAGDYLRRPGRYRPRASFLRHVTEMAGREHAPWLRAFAETSYATKLDLRGAAPTFRRLAGELLAAMATDAWPARRAALDRELELVLEAPSVLARVPGLSQFRRQAAPFMRAAGRAARAGATAADLLAATRPSISVAPGERGIEVRVAAPSLARAAAIRRALDARAGAARRDSRAAYGNRRRIPGIPVPEVLPPNRMDLFVDRVRAHDDAWRPLAPVAAGSVAATLGGRPLPLGTKGEAALAVSACGQRLRAVDGAGGATALVVRCRRDRGRLVALAQHAGPAPRAGRRVSASLR